MLKQIYALTILAHLVLSQETLEHEASNTDYAAEVVTEWTIGYAHDADLNQLCKEDCNRVCVPPCNDPVICTEDQKKCGDAALAAGVCLIVKEMKFALMTTVHVLSMEMTVQHVLCGVRHIAQIPKYGATEALIQIIARNQTFVLIGPLAMTINCAQDIVHLTVQNINIHVGCLQLTDVLIHQLRG